MDLPGISLSEVEGQVFLHFQPGPERPPVDSAALYAMLMQAGYGECLLHDNAINQAAHDCNTRSQPFELVLARRCDAAIDVKIASDDMSAELSLSRAKGGKAASVEDVMRALSGAGVVVGINDAAITEACQHGDCEALAVACGVLPEQGCDAIFEEMVPLVADRTPKLDANGLHDYRERGDIVVVQSGAPLMRRTPATPGVNGFTVRGGVLASRPGHDEPFAASMDGACLASDDPNLLQACVSGQPVRVRCGVMVEPILRVAEVNMATGNIHYDGTVQVDADVLQGMKVEASGDIVVGGMVDGGLLQAGGDIKVAGGVIAHARLRAGGSVSARFAEGANIHAGTLIVLDDMALECELLSLNQIIIGAGSPQRGRLIGGSTTAMMLVKVPVLGSEQGAIAKVLLGLNPELDARYDDLQQRIDKEKVTEESLHKLVTQLTSTGDPKGLLERVKASRAHAVQVWGKFLVERNELDQQRALGLTAKLEVGVGVAGAVDLSFGRLVIRLRQDFEAGSFSLNSEGEVVFIDRSGNAKNVA